MKTKKKEAPKRRRIMEKNRRIKTKNQKESGSSTSKLLIVSPTNTDECRIIILLIVFYCLDTPRTGPPENISWPHMGSQFVCRPLLSIGNNDHRNKHVIFMTTSFFVSCTFLIESFGAGFKSFKHIIIEA